MSRLARAVAHSGRTRAHCCHFRAARQRRVLRSSSIRRCHEPSSSTAASTCASESKGLSGPHSLAAHARARRALVVLRRSALRSRTCGRIASALRWSRPTARSIARHTSPSSTRNVLGWDLPAGRAAVLGARFAVAGARAHAERQDDADRATQAAEAGRLASRLPRLGRRPARAGLPSKLDLAGEGLRMRLVVDQWKVHVPDR